MIAIRKLLSLNKNVNLFILLQVQEKYFIKCIKIYEFEVNLYVILEHMSIFLVQIVATFVHSKETHVIAIVKLIEFYFILSKRRH